MPTGTEVVRDAEVILISSSNVRQYSSTRQDGTFAFGGVSAGTYTLKINPPKALSGVTAPPEQSIVVLASQTKDVGTVRLLAAKKKIIVTIADEDGTKITNAKVQAVERSGQGFISTETSNIAGQFELSVGGGTWLVTALSRSASTGEDEWLFGGAPKPVEFTMDPATEQTSTLAFIVRKTELKKVVGKVCKAPCSTLNPALYDFVGVKIRIEDSNGFGNTVDSNSTGNYGMRLPKGSYRIKFFPPDTSWAPPLMVLDKDSKLVSLANFEIKIPAADGNPIQIPTVVFSQKPASVTGSVKDANGNVVSGVPVNVWQKDGKDFGTTVTGTDGSYSLSVGLGSWFIAPAPTLASGYTFLDPPTLVNITASGAVAIPAFTLIVPAGTIEGSIVDSTTNAAITNARGMATATGRDGTKGSIQAPILDGKFTIKVPAGKFTVSVSFPPGSGYSPTATKSAELTTLAPSVTVLMPVAATNATISGALQVNGTTLTGVPASVYFDGGDGKKEWTRVNPATGLYSLVVAPGTWFIRGFIDAENSSYVVVNTTTNKVTVEATKTVTANLAVLQAGGTITGTVKDATGVAISGARVWAVDSQRTGRDAVASITTEADANGAFTLKVPAGAYKVNAAANGNYLPPAPTTVTVTSGATQTVALVFRALDSTITGVASINGTPQPNAFIRAYPSGGGGGRSATTDAHGAFSLSVTGGLTWNIQATAEKTASDGTLQAFRSALTEVAVPAAGTKAQNLEMKVARTMPSPVSLTFDVTESQTLELADGTRVIIPAGAMGSSGTATIRITPKNQVEQTQEYRPLDLAYEFVAIDSVGSPITLFNSPVSIVFKYDLTKLPPGTSATDLVPQYWDPVTNSWKPVGNIVVNTVDQTITINVTRFTDFAIMAEVTGSTSTSPTQTVGAIAGVVNDPNGDPANAWVELRTLDKKRAKDTTGKEISGVSANLSQAGSFSFSNVPNGSYLVQATVGSSSGSAGSFETPVKIVSGIQTPASLVLKLTAIQFAGVVKNFDNSALTQQAGLKFTSSDKSVVHYSGTNDKGEFKVGALPISSAAGALTYTVEASPPYQTAGVGSAPQAGITPASSAALNITLNLGQVAVKGKVIMPTGTEAVREAEVILISSSNARIYGSTRQDGTFGFGNVSAGTYTLKINPPKALAGVTAPADQSVIVVAGQQKDVGSIALRTAKKKILVTIADEDGTKITSAKVQAVERGGLGFINTEVANSSGQFELSVGTGTWLVMALSKNSSSGDDEWLYGGAPKPVEFSIDPATEETSTLAFTVRKTDLKKVVGNICKSPCLPYPDREPYYFAGVNVRIEDANGFGNTLRADSTGYFGMRLPKGNYRIKFFPPDTSWTPPVMVTDKNSKLVPLATYEIKVPSSDGNRVELPTFVFTQKPASLTGSVKDGSGNAVSGVPVNAWQKDGKDFGSTVSGTDGTFSLAVGVGSWFIGPAPTLASGYAFLERPTIVEVTGSGAVAVPAFTLIVPDGTIEGSVVDSTTNASITSVRGMATAIGRDGTKGFLQAPILDGKFTIKVPTGKYTVSISLPPGSGYSPTATKTADPTTQTPSVTVAIPLAATSAIISGSLQNNGTTLTGIPATIFVDGGEGKKEWTRVNPTTGAYSLTVAPGTWFVRGYVDAENSGYVIVNTTTNKVSATAGQTSTLNLSVLQSGGTISGTVKDATGAAISGARVWAVDSLRAGRDAVGSITTETDASGAFTLKVPPGTYKVNAAAGGSYLPPAPTTVKVASGATETVALQFRTLDSTITGVASIGGTPQPNAFIRAYPSVGGGGRSVTADANGAFSLSVTGGLIWNIQATAETTTSDGTQQAYRSAITEVVVPAAGTVAQNLLMTLAGSMPAAISLSFDVTESQTLELSDGTKVIVPAGAMGTTGTATLRVTPKNQVEQSKEYRPLDLAYEFVAIDSVGTPITQFNSPVSIVFKYDPTKLPAGIAVTDLIPQYWDAVTNSWKPAENIVINTTDLTITINVTHFTDYAVMAEVVSSYRLTIPISTRNSGP